MKAYISELIGTFALVFAGTGAIIINDISGGVIAHIGIAFTFGLIVMAMIYSLGDISGAHINPAVTLGFWVAGRLPNHKVLPYIISQFIGALLASTILFFLFPQHSTLGVTLPSGSIFQTFILEIILTFFLMFVIINVSTGAKEKGLMAGIAIGAIVALSAMFAGPISGASMNPARSIGPAIVSGQIQELWIYILAPLIGAYLGIACCKCVQERGCCSRLQEQIQEQN
ncbi:MAG: MIP/aquaporin family protein [Dehalococcoidia bacterium]|nr:Aquaporin Z 2 [Chloroflexota bacterium]MBT9161544.1 Aquaporin Z 2 [Chloroflexota bacterium]